MPILGIIASQISGHLWPASSYESIATALPTSGTSVSFTSIPSTYQHLQIRFSIRCSSGSNIMFRINNDTGSNYSTHGINLSNTPSVATFGAANVTGVGFIAGYGSTNGTNGTYPNVGIVDFHNYASTTQNKTIRSFAGVSGNNNYNNLIETVSSGYYSLSAIDRIDILAGTFTAGTTIALYGIKGA